MMTGCPGCATGLSQMVKARHQHQQEAKPKASRALLVLKLGGDLDDAVAVVCHKAPLIVGFARFVLDPIRPCYSQAYV
jgi:hypothetical protein